MKKFVLLLVLAFVFCMGATFAQDTYFTQDYTGEVGAGYWMPSITGSLKPGVGATADQTFDLVNDLGVDNAGSVLLNFRYKFDATSSLYANYLSVENKGTKTLLRNITWRNNTFFTGDVIDTKVITKFVDIIYEKKVFESDSGYLCATLGVKYGGASLAITDTTRGGTMATSQKTLIPEVGLFGKTKITQNLNGIGRINFMKGNSGSKEGEMFDVDAGLTWDFYQNWACDLGYKWLHLKGKNTDLGDIFELNNGGPFLNFTYSY
ncbi:MAG: hypothetical protein ABIH00_10185 [Armatimonadota bacterium]